MIVMVISLTACTKRAILEIEGVNGCEVFEMGYPSRNDTIGTLKWFENHNDIYKVLCL